MPSFRDLYPDRWIKPEIIGRSAVVVTIEYANPEDVWDARNRKYEKKLAVKFVGKELRLICNKTQCQTLAKLCGTDDYTKWRGYKVRLTTSRASNGKDTIVIGAVSGSAPPPAQTPPPAQAQAQTPEAGDMPDDSLWDIDTPEEDVNFYPDNQSTGELVGARPPDPVARPVHGQGVTPEKSSARPQDVARINLADSPCPGCHAPAGKPHASKCNIVMHGQANLITADGEVSGTTVARPQDSSARPVEADDFEDRVYARVAAIYKSDIPLSNETMDFMRKGRNADSDSALKMDNKFFAALVTLLRSTLACEEYEAHLVLAAILGYRVGTVKGQKPGQLVHGYLVKPLRDKNQVAIDALAELLELCQYIWEEENSMEEYANAEA